MPPEDSAVKISILVILLLLAGLSLYALLSPTSVYPTAELRQAFLANDLVNLVVALPALLACLWLTARAQRAITEPERFRGRQNLVGRLLLPGALFYVTYNAIAAALALYPALAFLPNLLLVILSAYTVLHLLSADSRPVRSRLAGRVHERLAAGVLVAFGLLFFLMALGRWFGALSGLNPLPRSQVAVQLADLLTTPFWVAGGVLLWQRRPVGYTAAPAFLFQASLLFVGLLVYFILQPILTPAPFPLVDFLIVFGMGFGCFIPFALYLRAILTTPRA